jgi:hypothetical protein
MLGASPCPIHELVDEFRQTVASYSGTFQHRIEIRSRPTHGGKTTDYCSRGMVALDLLLLLAADFQQSSTGNGFFLIPAN